MGEDGFEQFSVAQMEMEVVGFAEGEGLGHGEDWEDWVWNGAGRVRTDGLLRARQALCQLSYSPVFRAGVLECSMGGVIA